MRTTRPDTPRTALIICALLAALGIAFGACRTGSTTETREARDGSESSDALSVSDDERTAAREPHPPPPPPPPLGTVESSATLMSGSVALSSRHAATPATIAAADGDRAAVDGPVEHVEGTETEADKAGKIAQQTTPSPGQLTAGEWRDLSDWDYWTGVLADSSWRTMPAHWGFNPAHRVVVRVNAEGRPFMDAAVTLATRSGKVLWRGRTDNAGVAYAFPSVFEEQPGPYLITASDGERTAQAMVDAVAPSDELKLSLPTRRAANGIDLMFMVDATGSMGDEMQYLKSELENVITRVQDMDREQADVRLSCNVYRDEGDEYLVRAFPFTQNIGEAVDQLRQQEAGGGGDFEEAVEVALNNAINEHDWRPRARARILFLVLDAPPHHTPERLQRLQELARTAAERGIRIVPVAASGVDKETEFLLRFLAVTTGGTYTFITDHSGIGGSHIRPTIGKYNIELLNNLLVRVISAYAAS